MYTTLRKLVFNAVIFLSLAAISTISSEKQKMAKKIVVIRQYDNCPDVDDTFPARLIHREIILLEGGKYAIMGVMMAKRDIAIVDKATIRVDRCPSFAEREKCEFLTQVPLKGSVICRRLKQKNEFWSQLVGNIHPPFHCPFKKGNYTLKRTIIEPGRFLNLLSNVEGNYYKFTCNGYEGNDRLACVQFGGEIVTVRV